MRKKYFFFDIDGTLTDRSNGQIVPSAREALDKLRQAGHFVAINTGRAHYKARKFFDQYGFDNMVCNGGMGIVINRELVENRPLDFEKALRVYNYCLDQGIGVLAAMDDSEKVYARDFTFYDQIGPRREPTVYIIDPAFDPAKMGAIYKLYTATTEERRKALPFPGELGYVNFEPDYTIVQHDDKRAGIYRMLELAGGRPEDVIVFGDDTNDIDMFAPEFYSIAMGNGHPDLKAAADEVAPANIDDGIYRVCEAHRWFE
ncbi:MAG: HAD family hydrolase [Eubacteriales bacterium]|nr:HAD family hydrolase [Eubacteriales bacterium]